MAPTNTKPVGYRDKKHTRKIDQKNALKQNQSRRMMNFNELGEYIGLSPQIKKAAVAYTIPDIDSDLDLEGWPASIGIFILNAFISHCRASK